MNENPKALPVASLWVQAKAVVLEAMLLAAIAAVLAFGANAVSPRGLTLTRNYFPGGTNGAVAMPAPSAVSGIKEKGLQWIDVTKTLRLFQDPRFRQQMIVFIDARDAEQYRNGHIPGAFEFDPYYPEKHLAEALPACLAAEEVVVYCGGGDCEDSQFAALALRDAGVPNPRLFVFVGGFSGWTTNGLPVETGERNSGTLRPTTQ